MSLSGITGMHGLVGAVATVGVGGLTYVGGTKGNGASASAITAALNALTGGSDSAPAAGDIVIGAWGVPDGGAVTPNITGYTSLASLTAAGAGVDTWLRVAYKVMSGSPDTSATLTATGHVNYQGSYAFQVWRGQNATPIDVATTTATGITRNPDPPSITPVTAGAIIIAVGANSNSAGSDAVPAPIQGGDLMNFLAQDASANPGGNDHTAIGMGSKAWTSGAFDPASWTGGSSGVTWAAVSLALRPA